MTYSWARIRTTLLLGCLLLAVACGGPAPPEEGAPAGAASSAGGEGLLPGPMPPDPCETLTEQRAAELLGGEVVKRATSGPACSYTLSADSADGFVRLLSMAYPLEQFDSSAGDRAALAQTIGAAAQLDSAPAFHSEIAGAPAFSTEQEGLSALFVATGVRTTAMASDRPVGEVVLTLSLQTAQAHQERLAALEGLAAETIEALRREAGATP